MHPTCTSLLKPLQHPVYSVPKMTIVEKFDCTCIVVVSNFLTVQNTVYSKIRQQTNLGLSSSSLTVLWSVNMCPFTPKGSPFESKIV